MNAAPTRRPVALVVDHPPELSLLLGFFLTQSGFDVRSVADGESALVEAERSHPDLVCLDLMLPRMCGLEVCERLRAQHATARSLVVITSARRSLADRADAMRAGADAFLSKPVELLELSAIIERVRAGERHAS